MKWKIATRHAALAAAVVLSVPVFAQVNDPPTKAGLSFLNPNMSDSIGRAHVAAASATFKKFGQQEKEANSEKIGRFGREDHEANSEKIAR